MTEHPVPTRQTHERLASAKEAAQRLGVEPETVRRWARADKIGHVHVGPARLLRFRERDIAEAIERHAAREMSADR